MEHGVGGRGGPLADERDIGVPVGGEGDGLAGPDVVKGGLLDVQHGEVLAGAEVLYSPHPVAAPEGQDGLGAAGDHHVDVAGDQALGGHHRVGYGIDLDAVEVDVDGVGGPVGGVLDQHRHLVLGPALDHVGPGADRHLVEAGVLGPAGQPLRGDHLAELAGEELGEGAVAPDGVVLHGVVVDLDDGVLLELPVHRVGRTDGQPHDRVGELGQEGGHHVVGVEFGAVVEEDPLPQLELPRRSVANLGERLGQMRHPVAVDIPVGDRLDDREGHDVGRDGEVVGGGVQAVGLGLHRHPQGAPELGLFGLRLWNLGLGRHRVGGRGQLALVLLLFGGGGFGRRSGFGGGFGVAAHDSLAAAGVGRGFAAVAPSPAGGGQQPQHGQSGEPPGPARPVRSDHRDAPPEV